MSWRVRVLPKRQLWAVRVSSAVRVRPNARKSDQKPFTSSHDNCLAEPLQAARPSCISDTCLQCSPCIRNFLEMFPDHRSGGSYMKMGAAGFAYPTALGPSWARNSRRVPLMASCMNRTAMRKPNSSPLSRVNLHATKQSCISRNCY